MDSMIYFPEFNTRGLIVSDKIGANIGVEVCVVESVLPVSQVHTTGLDLLERGVEDFAKRHDVQTENGSR